MQINFRYLPPFNKHNKGVGTKFPRKQEGAGNEENSNKSPPEAAGIAFGICEMRKRRSCLADSTFKQDMLYRIFVQVLPNCSWDCFFCNE